MIAYGILNRVQAYLRQKVHRIGLSIVAFQHHFHLHKKILQLLIIPEELKCGAQGPRLRGCVSDIP